MKLSLHFTLRGTGIVIVIRIEHRDYGDGATAIMLGPLALDECALHGFPVIGRWFRRIHGLEGFAW